MSLLLIDLSGKNDTRCTVGNKARRKSLPWLLMTLLRSIPHGALYFLLHSLNVCSCLSSISHLSPRLSAILYKNMFQLKMSCWPTLSILLFAVPVSRQIEWASLSLWLCAVLTDRWASQLIPSLVFVELWNVCCCWIRPSAAFLPAGPRFCSAGGQLVNPKLFKVIRVTVCKINSFLILPLHPSLLSPYKSGQIFQYIFCCINKSNN